MKVGNTMSENCTGQTGQRDKESRDNDLRASILSRNAFERGTERDNCPDLSRSEKRRGREY